MVDLWKDLRRINKWKPLNFNFIAFEDWIFRMTEHNVNNSIAQKARACSSHHNTNKTFFKQSMNHWKNISAKRSVPVCTGYEFRLCVLHFSNVIEFLFLSVRQRQKKGCNTFCDASTTVLVCFRLMPFPTAIIHSYVSFYRECLSELSLLCPTCFKLYEMRV